MNLLHFKIIANLPNSCQTFFEKLAYLKALLLLAFSYYLPTLPTYYILNNIIYNSKRDIAYSSDALSFLQLYIEKIKKTWQVGNDTI